MDENTPDAEAFRPRGLLQASRFACSILLEDVSTGGLLTGYRLQLPPTVTDVQTRLAAFAERWRPLHCPGLATLREYRMARQPWLLFDYVEGPPLSHYLEAALSSGWTVTWLLQLLEVVAWLHAQKLVLGSLGPEDLVVTPERVHIANMGFIDLLFADVAALGRAPARRAFMAPEDRHAVQPTAAGNLYTVGAIAYWLLTGQAPGSADRLAGSRRTPLMERHVEGRARTLCTMRPDLSQEAAEAIARLIQFLPNDRGDAPSVLATLKRPTLAGPPPPPVQPFEPTPLHAPAAPAQTTPPVRVAAPPEVVRAPSRFWPAVGLTVLLIVGIAITAWPRPKPVAAAPAANRLAFSGQPLLVNVQSHWRRAREATAGTTILCPPGPNSGLVTGTDDLKWQLRPDSSVRVVELTEAAVAAQVLGGHLVLATGGRPTHLQFPGGDADCASGTEVDVVVEKSHSTLAVHKGVVTLGSHESAGPGQTIEAGGGLATPRIR